MDYNIILREKRDDILRTATERGVFNLRVFGSVARGEAYQGDIDFLVDVQPGRSLFDLGGLVVDLQEILGCKVDIVTTGSLRPRFRERVMKEAIPL